MKYHAPTAKMKVTTKIERIQPTCIGLDDKGEIIWEGKAMSTWQMMLLPVKYVGDFLAHWSMNRMFHHTGIEHDEPMASMDIKTNRYDYLKKQRATWGD